MSIKSVTRDVLAFNITKTHLSPIETYALRLTCRSMSAQLRDVYNFHELLLKRLEKFGLNANLFAAMLTKHGHYIGGSFVLKVLLGVNEPEEFEESKELEECEECEESEELKDSKEPEKPVKLKECKKPVELQELPGWNKEDKGDMDVYGLDPRDGCVNYRHYTRFVHEAFEYQNKFYPKSEFEGTLPASATVIPEEGRDRNHMTNYPYDRVKDLLPISFSTGKPISEEEWKNGYAQNAERTLIWTNKGNIMHVGTIGEKLIPLRPSDAYLCFPVSNLSYVVRTGPWRPYEPQLRAGNIFDYNIIYEYKSVLAYLDNCCDMAFTKVAYDGKRVYIRDLDALLLKRTTVHVEKLYAAARKVVNGHDHGVEEAKDVYDGKFYCRILARQLKYLKRGFQVKVIFNSKGTYGSLIPPLSSLEEKHTKDVDEDKETRKISQSAVELFLADHMTPICPGYSLATFRQLVDADKIVFEP